MKTLKLCGYLLLGYVVVSVLRGLFDNSTDNPKVRVAPKDNNWNIN